MTIEQQVCTVGLGKKLNELGVKQESYFWWFAKNVKEPRRSKTVVESCTKRRFSQRQGERKIFRFTVAELGEMLPERCRYWRSGLRGQKEQKQMGTQTADTEADARAKMLIYLIENQLVPTVYVENVDYKSAKKRLKATRICVQK